MIIKFKNILKILVGAILTVQLGGCIFVDHEHDHWHHDHVEPAVVYVH